MRWAVENVLTLTDGQKGEIDSNEMSFKFKVNRCVEWMDW